MGKRGPKKTPTAILDLRGSRRASDRPDLRVHPELPDPPAWLIGPALDMWGELAPMLYHAKVLTLRDRNALARYCCLWQRWRQAEEQVDKLGVGLVSRDKDGQAVLRRNPVAIEARNLAVVLDRMESAFGLNPASRSAIGFLDRSESRPETLASYKQVAG